MQYQDKNHYVVKSMYLCRHLQQLGFELKKVKPNKFYPRHNVYLFEHTEDHSGRILTAYNKRLESNIGNSRGDKDVVV